MITDFLSSIENISIAWDVNIVGEALQTLDLCLVHAVYAFFKSTESSYTCNCLPWHGTTVKL
jgi:hypothetical protein